MKNRKIKPILVLALTALLLTAAVSGTLAYLFTSTGTVVNTFEPTQVSVTVKDEVSGKTKSNVVITNTSDIDVYIRAAIVGNWQNAQDIVVQGWENDIDEGDLGTGWEKGTDGYYYYTQKVAPSTELSTANGNALFGEYTYKAEDVPTNLVGETADHLQLDIIVQAIQAEGMGATSAQDAWAKAAQ